MKSHTVNFIIYKLQAVRDKSLLVISSVPLSRSVSRGEVETYSTQAVSGSAFDV